MTADKAANVLSSLISIAGLIFILWLWTRRQPEPDHYEWNDAIDAALADTQPSSHGSEQTAAARDVLSERRRHVEQEWWAPQHDDEHTESEMALAAACYAMSAAGYAEWQTPPVWPWPLQWWKPTYGRRDLIKAGALILAEIERLDRAASPQPQEPAEAPAGERP